MKTYSITQAQKLLNVDNKTFSRWLTKAEITPQTSKHDERVKRITQEQLERLASIHERPIGALPVEKEVHPTVRALERKVDALTERIERVEREVEYQDDISDRVDTLAEQVKQLAEQIQELRQLALTQASTMGRKAPKTERHTSDTVSSRNVTTEANKATGGSTAPHRIEMRFPDDKPPDAIPYHKFVKALQADGFSINARSFRDRVDAEFAHYGYYHASRDEWKRYFSQEQQAAIIKSLS